jgi:hypothetical protein
MRLSSHVASLGLLVTVAVALIAAPLVASPAADLKTLEDDLRKAINLADLEGVDQVVAKIRAGGGADGVKLLIKIAEKVPPGAENTYWRLVNGAASFRDDEGLAEVGEAIVRAKGAAMSRDLLFALGNNRSPKVAKTIYAVLLDKGSDEFQLMAADNLAGIESVEAVDVLIAAYKKEEKKRNELTRRLLSGLKWLTGADCGNAEAWEAWWKASGRAAGLQGRTRREESTGTAVDQAEGARVEELVGLEKLRPEHVLVLVDKCKKGGCNFDDIAKLLKEMKLPHTEVARQDLEAGKVALNKAIVVILTCVQLNPHCLCPTCIPSGGINNRLATCSGCNKHDNVTHKLTQKTAQMLRDWVEKGGYLFSEDWGIIDMTEDWNYDSTSGQNRPTDNAWAKFIKKGKKLKSQVVPVVPSRGKTSHPLLRGVFVDPNAQAGQAPGREGDGTVSREDYSTDSATKIERRWKIDDESPVIDVVNKSAVITLMESDVLGREGGSSVAVTFMPAGSAAAEKSTIEGKPEKMVGGRVLHVVSHFGKQESREDEFALQNLLLNFVLEAQRRMRK